MPVMSLIMIAIAMIAMAMTSASAEDGRPAEKSSAYLPEAQRATAAGPYGTP
jgi:hypothetical protein